MLIESVTIVLTIIVSAYCDVIFDKLNVPDVEIPVRLGLSKEARKYCPVSSLLDTEVDGILSYPVDIFDPELARRIEGTKDEYILSQLFNGTSTAHENKYHMCSNIAKCPLNQESFKAAKNISLSYTYKHSLCQQKKDFGDFDSSTTLVVLGGSVTYGAASDGCCCSGKDDVKCKPFNSTEVMQHRWCRKDVEFQLCRWSTYLLRWFKSRSLGKVELINLSVGGCHSLCMLERIGDELASRGVYKLNSSYIVFLDSSVNDGLDEYSKHGTNRYNVC
jgi:hypothetical protein